MMRLRVAGPRAPPRVGAIAGTPDRARPPVIVPLFAGFLPVLFDDRRRALQDFLAGTAVRAEHELPPVGGVVAKGAPPDGRAPAGASEGPRVRLD